MSAPTRDTRSLLIGEVGVLVRHVQLDMRDHGAEICGEEAPDRSCGHASDLDRPGYRP
jgi:hypothetical protein